MFLYTFNTWLLANLLHPLMILAAMIVTGEHTGDILSAESFAMLVIFVSFSALFSLPCLFLSWWLLQIIVWGREAMLMKFIAWLLITALLIILEVLAFLFLTAGEIEIEILLCALPAVAATWAAIVFRWKQFMNLSCQHEVSNDDNNPVKTSE